MKDERERTERQGGTERPVETDRKTAGSNRDFDESGESINQGHGHPREEREGGTDRAGRSRLR